MRQGARQVFGQVQVQRPAEADVDLLHADADAQERQLPLQQESHQPPVAHVAALGHQVQRVVAGPAVAARVEGEAAREHKAVEPVEESVEVHLLADRRQDDGHAAGREDGVEVAGVEPDLGGRFFRGVQEVGVDADERARLGGHRFPP